MPTKSKSYRSWLQSRLSDPVAAANYLNAALNDSSEMFLKALRNVSEAHRMAKVAEDAGLSREALYRTLSEDGNPRLNSLAGILKAVGLKVRVEAEEPAPTDLRVAPATAAVVSPSQDKFIEASSLPTTSNGDSLTTSTFGEFLSPSGQEGLTIQGELLRDKLDSETTITPESEYQPAVAA